MEVVLTPGYDGAMKPILLLLASLFSPAVSAEAVAVTAGTVSLVQIKAETAKVPATITGVTGTVDLAAGTGKLIIPTSNWDSGLEIRDNNVRNVFFQPKPHPPAVFTLESLALSEGVGKAKGTLTLYLGAVPVEAEVKVSTDEQGLTHVATTAPFSVSISALGYSERLTALMKICEHPSVSDAVEVSISLTLAKE